MSPNWHTTASNDRSGTGGRVASAGCHSTPGAVTSARARSIIAELRSVCHQAAAPAQAIEEAAGDDASATGGFEQAHAVGDDQALGEIVGIVVEKYRPHVPVIVDGAGADECDTGFRHDRLL